jgi:hypothetical protein
MSGWSRIVNRKKSVSSKPKNTRVFRERLRRKYRPARVRLLFVGEAPPASGHFFYQQDSGLYRAILEAFAIALPTTRQHDFLKSFRDLGCYLVDLCREPVDRLTARQRKRTWLESEAGFAADLKRLRPQVVITVVRSIVPSVKRAQERANWGAPQLQLPYPGRWKRHRIAFVEQLVPFLRQNLAPKVFFQSADRRARFTRRNQDTAKSGLQ